MGGESFDQVEVLSYGSTKYVIGESLAKALGIKQEDSAKWLKYQIHERNLLYKKDYIDIGEGILFSPETAFLIFEKVNKPKDKPHAPRKSKRGCQLDEYGLPVLPPQERRGALINPYKL